MGLLLLSSLFGFVAPTPVAHADAGASTINFQARLQTASGAIVPDGDYDVQFKLYSAASGGTAEWTESYTSTSGVGSTDARVQVINGYLNVALGAITPFGTSINWTQQQFLTMNIGGTSSTPSWDGEMDPRLSLTSVPSAFALNNYNPTTGYSSSLQVAPATGGDQQFVVPDQGAAGTYQLLTTAAADNAYLKNPNGGDLNLQPSSGSVAIGTSSAPTQKLDVQGGNINTSGSIMTGGTARIDASGNVSAANLGVSGTASVVSLGATGSVNFQGSSNSTTAFQVLNSTGSAVMTVDTTNMQVIFGSTTNGVTIGADGITLNGTARKSKTILLAPSYAGAVMGDAGDGVMTTGYDPTNRTNYYDWTNMSNTDQSGTIIVQVPIPSDFSAWASTTPISVDTYSSDSNSSTDRVDLELIDSANSVPSGYSAIDLSPASPNSWQTTGTSTAITGTYSAGDYLTLQLTLTASAGEDVRVGNINLQYLSKY